MVALESTPLHASPVLAPKPTGDSGITEIILSVSEPPFVLALPMLAHLSRNSGARWLTWITPYAISKQVLLDYGFDLKKLRIVHVKNPDDARWITWEALINGNSDTVVASLNQLSGDELRELEEACVQGSSRGLLLRLRG